MDAGPRRAARCGAAVTTSAIFAVATAVGVSPALRLGVDAGAAVGREGAVQIAVQAVPNVKYQITQSQQKTNSANHI